VALVLHIVCGFSVDEIASAFVSSRSAIEKRIARGKRVLAKSKHLFDVTAGAEFTARLPSVQRALYLLFNEGYHGASGETAVRTELCREAMRLAAVLLEHPLRHAGDLCAFRADVPERGSSARSVGFLG
jgi:RNA polymerase sigma-70 factor (ECF subfamily)